MVLQDVIILERCGCCGQVTKKISLYDAQTNYLNRENGLR